MKLPAIKSSVKLRFVAVGILNTVVDFTVLFILVGIGIPKVTANIFSTTAAFLTSFIFNKKYTFEKSGSNLLHEMILFILASLFSIWIVQSSVIFIVAHIIEPQIGNNELSLLLSKLAAVTAGMVTNYFLYSRIVFKKH